MARKPARQSNVLYLHDQKMFMPPEPNYRVSVFHFAPSGGALMAVSSH